MNRRQGIWTGPPGVFADAPWIAWGLAIAAVACGARLLVEPTTQLLAGAAGVRMLPAGPGTLYVAVSLVVPALLAYAVLAELWPDRRSPRRRAVPVLAVSLGIAVMRIVILTVLGDRPLVASVWLLVEVVWFAALVAGVAVTVFSVADLARRGRDLHRVSNRLERSFATVLTALEDEEVRVRREVARELHGSLQHRLVVLETELRSVVDGLELNGESGYARRISLVLSDLDDVRETDVRRLSHTLFPAGADIGIDAAVLLLMERVPVSVLPTLEVDDAAKFLTGPDSTLRAADRLLIVGTIEEALTNALRHGEARRIDVHLRRGVTHRGARALVVEVLDDGIGLSMSPPVLHGLARIRERFVLRGGSLELAVGEDGGARLTAVLPG